MTHTNESPEYPGRFTASKLTKSFAGRIAFPITQQGLHSRIVISELNTEPARSSVNA